MTSTSTFDKFLFSADNTDEEDELSFEENSEIDSEQKEENNFEQEDLPTSKKNKNEESFRPYVKKSILTDDYLPIIPMAKQNKDEQNSSNGKKDSKRGKKNENQAQQNKHKADEKTKNKEKGEKSKPKKTNPATGGKKAKEVKPATSPKVINSGKGGKAGKEIAKGGSKTVVNNIQSIADLNQLSKVDGGKVSKPRSREKKSKNIDPTQKVLEQYRQYRNQVNLTFQEICKLNSFSF